MILRTVFPLKTEKKRLLAVLTSEIGVSRLLIRHLSPLLASAPQAIEYFEMLCNLDWSLNFRVCVKAKQPIPDLYQFRAPSTCIRFRLKTQLFFYGLAFRPQYPVKTVTENATFQKHSPEWTFLKTPFFVFSCAR